MRTVPDSSVPADRESALSSWEMDQGRGAAENRTQVWPAVSLCCCCYVWGLSPNLRGKVIRGRVRSANLHGL